MNMETFFLDGFPETFVSDEAITEIHHISAKYNKLQI